MPLQAAVYETGPTLFQPPDTHGADRPADPLRGSGGRSGATGLRKAGGPRADAASAPSPGAEEWRAKAEEIARNYQRLLKSYRRLKEHAKEETEWRKRCNAMLNDSLRNCRDLEFAIAAADKQARGNPALDGLVAGIKQVIDTQLQQLHALDLVEQIEPQASELFDDTQHEAVQTVVSDDYAAGLIAGLVAVGYACAGKVVRKAKVILAASSDTTTEGTADRRPVRS